MVAISEVDLYPFWKVEVLYMVKNSFFMSSAVTVAEVDLYLFWKVGSVICGWG